MSLQKIYKYKAIGFVEALIAIAVAGVSSIVLMGLAVDTISQVLRNETSDKMTELSIEGASMAKKIADNQEDSETALFPTILGNIGKCYAFGGDVEDPAFLKNGGLFVNACNYDAADRESCKEYTTDEEDIFRVFCFLPESVEGEGLVVGKVVSGLIDCDTQRAGSKCSIPDYEYFVAVKVKQVEE